MLRKLPKKIAIALAILVMLSILNQTVVLPEWGGQPLSLDEKKLAFYAHHSAEMQRLVNVSTIMDWKPRQDFEGFLSYFGRKMKDERMVFVDDASRNDVNTTSSATTTTRTDSILYSNNLCKAWKQFLQAEEKTPHVLFLPLNENWGGLSYYIENRTVDWGSVLDVWANDGCSLQDILQYLDHPSLLGVYTTQFQLLDHPKVHSIPIGIQHDALYAKVARKAPVKNRNQLLMLNQSPWNHRVGIANMVQAKFPVNNTYGKSQQEFIDELRHSKFILSPSGMGYDCYRIWEALYVGTIPIVERRMNDGWYRTLQNLPILLVDDFTQVTPAFLEAEYERIVSASSSLYRYEKLTKQYWWNLVDDDLRRVAQPEM